MNARTKILQFRRAKLETYIEELISLLDTIDGDADAESNGDEIDTGMPEGWAYSTLSSWDGSQAYPIEDDEDGGDAEPEETDENGDELDCCGSEEEFNPTLRANLRHDGTGVDIGKALVKGLPTFYDRECFKRMIADGLDPNRSEIDRMRRYGDDYWSTSGAG